jgi:hypothetical protein
LADVTLVTHFEGRMPRISPQSFNQFTNCVFRPFYDLKEAPAVEDQQSSDAIQRIEVAR